MLGIAAARARLHPYIVHYASVPKPWHFGYGLTRPYSSYFFAALELTAWKGWMPAVRLRQVVRTHFPTLYGSARRLYQRLRSGLPRT
jgi:hypothetical protein